MYFLTLFVEYRKKRKKLFFQSQSKDIVSSLLQFTKLIIDNQRKTQSFRAGI